MPMLCAREASAAIAASFKLRVDPVGTLSLVRFEGFLALEYKAGSDRKTGQ